MTDQEERSTRMGEVVRAALVDLTESQTTFAKRIGVSPNKFREIRDGKPGNYRPDTLAKISEGLWGRPDVLRRVLEGEDRDAILSMWRPAENVDEPVDPEDPEGTDPDLLDVRRLVRDGWFSAERWATVGRAIRRIMDAHDATVGGIVQFSGVDPEVVTGLIAGDPGDYESVDLVAVSQVLWGHSWAIVWLLNGISIADVEGGVARRLEAKRNQERYEEAKRIHHQDLGRERVAELNSQLAYEERRLTDLREEIADTGDGTADEEHEVLLEYWTNQRDSTIRSLDPPRKGRYRTQSDPPARFARSLIEGDRAAEVADEQRTRRDALTQLVYLLDAATLSDAVRAVSWLAARAQHETLINKGSAAMAIGLEDFVNLDTPILLDLIAFGSQAVSLSSTDAQTDVEDHAMAAASGEDPTGIPDTPEVNRPSPPIEPDGAP